MTTYGLLLTLILATMTTTDILLEDFRKGDTLGWFIVNDDVMGGRSTSDMEIAEDGIGRFYGEVSLENNGGFASVRAPLDTTLSESVSRFVIRVKGDGNRYDFRLRTSRTFDGVAYVASFDTEPGEWQAHTIELADFRAQYRGRVVDAPTLSADDVQQIGFLIADKQQGAFELLIDWVKAG